MKRLEEIAAAYWQVGTALRHPAAPAITVEEALTALRIRDKCRPEEWRLAANMHEITFDIIEGNTKWREKRKVQDSRLIPFTRR